MNWSEALKEKIDLVVKGYHLNRIKFASSLNAKNIYIF